MASGDSGCRRVAEMAALIVAGEAVFGLPFVLARVFRPTLLDVFGLSDLELGLAFSVYGVVAMLAYLVGGPLADRYSARRLMTVALLATAAGGLVFVGVPSLGALRLVYAWWGATTVLLFWAPLIRATREWGGDRAQGRAYGLLDGGRGLVSALLGTASVVVFASLLPGEAASASLAEREAAFIEVIWLFTGLTAAAGMLIWFAVPERRPDAAQPSSRSALLGLRMALARPSLWLHAIIVVCAYVGYKSTDDLSLYARDVYGYDDVAAAKIGSLLLWVRPFAAIAAGIIGDRLGAAKVTLASFVLMIFGCMWIALGIPIPGIHWMLVFAVVVTAAGVNALRGIYFALLGEGGVELAHTGSAVGLVSLVGYTPDVFMGPLMGVLLDRAPGALGHQHLFAVVAGFGVLGVVCTLVFRRTTRR
jgi:nitrate/nitrite transporter NarK